MTQTPMNAIHKEQDTKFLVESVRTYMRAELVKMLAILEDPNNFSAGYLGDPGTEVADQIVKFAADTNEILLTGRNYLRNNMTSPAAADGAFVYLEGKGVWGG